MTEALTHCRQCGAPIVKTPDAPWPETAPDAGCLNDLDRQWRRVAWSGTRDGVVEWLWNGDLAFGAERKLFLSAATPETKRGIPRISTVQARTADGVVRLYARWHPRHPGRWIAPEAGRATGLRASPANATGPSRLNHGPGN